MATIAQLQSDFAALQTAVTAAQAELASQSSMIVTLQTQLQAGTPVTQAQLDTLDASIQAASTALSGSTASALAANGPQATAAATGS